MEDFKSILIASLGVLMVAAISAPTGLTLNTKVANSDSAFKPRKARIFRVLRPPARSLVCLDRTHGDRDIPTDYSPLGITNVNGRRIAVYIFRKGAKANDVAGRGEGSADVFDRAGRLVRRFSFRENLNSPPQITEYVFMPAR